jgi:membrane fusion protein (multidrug efflux system)
MPTSTRLNGKVVQPQLDAEKDEAPLYVPRRPPLKRILTMVILLAALGWGASYGVHAFEFASRHETTDDAFIDGHVVAISPRVAGHVAKVLIADNQAVKKGQLLVVLDAADFEARVEQAEGALESAREKLAAARNSVTVTHRTSYGGVDQARAGLREAEANVTRADSAISTAQASVEVAREHAVQASAQVSAARHAAAEAAAQVKAAAVEEARSAKEETRYRALYGQGYVTAQQRDDVVAAHSAAMARLDAARSQAAESRSAEEAARANERAAARSTTQAEAGVAEAQASSSLAREQVGEAGGKLREAQAAPARVEVSQKDVRMARGEVTQAEAALRQARLNLSYTRIYAPLDGRVTRRLVEPGAWFPAGQPMLSIVDPQVWVTANYKETQLARIRPGQSVTIKLDAYGGAPLHGRVDSIQRGSGAAFSLLPPQNATGNYVKVVQRVPVKIVIDDPRAADYVLGPGMSVEPEVAVR